jgi:aspartyl/asparaginyl-tRNA synthetase
MCIALRCCIGRRTCLTVSGQLNVETHACALSDVYTFGPTFRYAGPALLQLHVACV